VRNCDQEILQRIKAGQALLEMTQFAQPMINLEAIAAYRQSLELSTNLANASNKIFAQAAALANEHLAAYADVNNNFNAWNAANQRLLDALPKFDFSLFEGVPKSYPPNWTSDYDPGILEEIIYKDGIPVVWVPNARILDLIVVAPDRAARISILVEAAEEILADCQRVIAESNNVELLGVKPLAVHSTIAWLDHPEAAQALAVVVADTIIKRWLPKITMAQNYTEMGESVKLPLAEVPIVNVRQAFALAVISSFYTKFDSNDHETRPSALSRHVTVHDANIEHFHRENSLIAIMVMSSLIRTFNDLI